MYSMTENKLKPCFQDDQELTENGQSIRHAALLGGCGQGTAQKITEDRNRDQRTNLSLSSETTLKNLNEKL